MKHYLFVLVFDVGPLWNIFRARRGTVLVYWCCLIVSVLISSINFLLTGKHTRIADFSSLMLPNWFEAVAANGAKSRPEILCCLLLLEYFCTSRSVKNIDCCIIFCTSSYMRVVRRVVRLTLFCLICLHKTQGRYR